MAQQEPTTSRPKGYDESSKSRRSAAGSERVSARKAEQRRQLEEDKAQLLRQIGVMRDGSGIPVMQRLITHAAASSSPSRYTKVSLEPIVRDFGYELADAFSEGLTKVWRQISVPSSADYPANRVPWAGLIGLASVNHAFARGLDVQSLSAEDITRAVQLCVWEIERPEPWLDKLVEIRMDTVVAALMPWFEREIGLTADDNQILTDCRFCTSCVLCIAAALPTASSGDDAGRPGLWEAPPNDGFSMHSQRRDYPPRS